MRKETAILDVHLQTYAFMYVYTHKYMHSPTQQTGCIYFQSNTHYCSTSQVSGQSQWHHQLSMHNPCTLLFSVPKVLRPLRPGVAAVVTFSQAHQPRIINSVETPC